MIRHLETCYAIDTTLFYEVSSRLSRRRHHAVTRMPARPPPSPHNVPSARLNYTAVNTNSQLHFSDTLQANVT